MSRGGPLPPPPGEGGWREATAGREGRGEANTKPGPPGPSHPVAARPPSPGGEGKPFSHIDTWLFDLDDTLYPLETGMMDLIRDRITGFVMRVTGKDRDEARMVQRGWFEAHGASLPGLLNEHNVSVRAFLDDIHDVPLDSIPPDPELARALDRLPGRRLVFTNGSSDHAARVLERLGVAQLFEAVFHIESNLLIPKPDPRTFQAIIDAFGFEPHRAAFFEDSERNLKPAADFGMTTILVGPHALASQAAFVHHRTDHLVTFLKSIRLPETVL